MSTDIFPAHSENTMLSDEVMQMRTCPRYVSDMSIICAREVQVQRLLKSLDLVHPNCSRNSVFTAVRIMMMDDLLERILKIFIGDGNSTNHDLQLKSESVSQTFVPKQDVLTRSLSNGNLMNSHNNHRVHACIAPTYPGVKCLAL